MDINVLQIRGGNSVNTKSIGTWTAGLDSPLVVKDEEIMKNLTADTVYRIYTVVVSIACFIVHCIILNMSGFATHLLLYSVPAQG